jgi:hypothetical protein
MDVYLVRGQRLKVKDIEVYGVYNGTIVFSGKEYKSLSGFANAVSGKHLNGWTSVFAEVKDGEWFSLDEIRKKFCELA